MSGEKMTLVPSPGTLHRFPHGNWTAVISLCFFWSMNVIMHPVVLWTDDLSELSDLIFPVFLKASYGEIPYQTAFFAFAMYAQWEILCFPTWYFSERREFGPSRVLPIRSPSVPLFWAVDGLFGGRHAHLNLSPAVFVWDPFRRHLAYTINLKKERDKKCNTDWDLFPEVWSPIYKYWFCCEGAFNDPCKAVWGE